MKSKFLKSIKPLAESDSEEFVKVDNELLAEDNNNDSDEDVHHSNLLKDISKLDPNKHKSLKWKATRFESKKDVNEFNISKSREQLTINDLLKNVKQTTGGLKKLKHWHKKHIMDAPLEKPAADLIKRKVNYNLSKKTLEKWDPIVEGNRNAPQLQFPLKQETLKLMPATEAVQHFQPKTKLEREVAELLNKSENKMTDTKALTVAEEKILKAMSLEEAIIRHKELQKMRALLSYQEVKLKRQSKIKSKRYHRILKKEKLKKSLQEFEESKKTDPQTAIDKLQELDKLRALERASLKHKNTGKWAKHLKLRSKYDESARIALSEQLQISQKLLQKRENNDTDEEVNDNNVDESDSEDENENQDSKKNTDNKFEDLPADYNPWLKSGQKNQPKPQLIQEPQEKPEDQAINYETSGPIGQLNEESDEEVINILSNTVSQTKESKPNEEEIETQKDVQIDPNDFISIKAHKLKSSFPNMVTELDSEAESIDESDDVSDNEQKKLVSEAFADDDVINDFKKEKINKIENEGEKDINLHLPGWGTWGGTGLKPSKRKVKKFTVKANKKPRKDCKLGNVIISEKKDDIIAKYRVSSLPFPFKNVEEYEKSIRLPIGRTWNPETAFRELTEPKVITKMGTVIDPIDNDALLNKPVKRRTIIPRIKRKKQKQNNETQEKNENK